MRYREQPYHREERNQWRDGPQEYRGHHPENRMQTRGGGPGVREQRDFEERPARGGYERDRMHPQGGRDFENHEDAPREAAPSSSVLRSIDERTARIERTMNGNV